MFDTIAPEFIEVPSTAPMQGVDAISEFPQQIAAILSMVVFGMPDHQLNRHASFE